MDMWNDVRPKKRRRLQALMLLLDFEGTMPRSRMAETLGITRKQLLRWVQMFNRGGLEGLIHTWRRGGRPRKITNDEFVQWISPLLKRVGNSEEEIPSVAAFYARLKASYPISFSYPTLARLLRRRGYVLRKPNQSRSEKDPPFSRLPYLIDQSARVQACFVPPTVL